MNYSMRFKDASGRTQRSDFIPFDNDEAAIAHARAVLTGGPIIEVWCDDPAPPKPAAKSIASWENEGGSSFVRR